MSNPTGHLDPTPTVDSDHPTVIEFAQKSAGDADPDQPVEIARRLFYAVRDGVRYDPYSVSLTVQDLRASTTLSTRRGWCVPKAALLAACCRAQGIPARLGFADVRNHLTTERLRAVMNTDVFCWHGYTLILLEGRWIKATPAFNIELCEKMKLKPLEFDGVTDALLQPFDLEGHQHMEYLRDRGEYDDIPIEALMKTMLEMYANPGDLAEADFERDVADENE